LNRTLNASYIGNRPNPKKVGARLLLTAGSLKIASRLAGPVVFGTYKDDNTFTTGMHEIEHMAQSVEVSLVFHQAPLHLVLTRFADGKGAEQDVQRFAIFPVGNEIDIAILNLPADELLGRQNSTRHSYATSTISDHFLLYYNLSANPTPPFYLPAKPVLGGQPYCGIAQFPPP
jgi:hypothetical protein